MSTWQVDTTKLKQQSTELKTFASRISDIGTDIQTTGNFKGMSLPNQYVLQRQISELGTVIVGYSNNLRNMSSGLSYIALTYDQTEKDILNNLHGLQSNWNENNFIINSITDNSTGGEPGDSDESDKTADKDPIAALIKAWLTIQDKGYHRPEAGFIEKLISYWNSLMKFYTGDKSGLTGASNFCDLGKTSSKLWNALYKVLKNNDPSKLLEKKYGKGAAGVSVIGSFLGLAGAIVDAFDSDSNTFLGKTADFLDAGAEGFEFGQSVYDFRHLAEISQNKGLYTPSSLWTTFGETTVSTVAQFFRSIDQYSSDGVWDLADTAATGIDSSIAGLEKMVSSLTFGIISADTFGTTPEEISQGMKDWASNTGKSAGNYILQHSDLKEEYNNGNMLDKIRITAYATFMSWF